MVAPAHDMFCVACSTPKRTLYCIECGADASGADWETRRLVGQPNWGASLLPGIWPLWHGRPWTAVVWWVLVAATALRYRDVGGDDILVKDGIVLAVGIALYLLVRGNRVALTQRPFRDRAAFLTTQAAWRMRGVAVATLCALAYVGVTQISHPH